MEYAVEYRARKTLGICVHPDGSVEVKAPMEAPLEQIRKHVHRRAPWIYKQQRYFASFAKICQWRITFIFRQTIYAACG